MRYPLSAPNTATDIKLNMIAAGPEITGAKNITPKTECKIQDQCSTGSGIRLRYELKPIVTLQHPSRNTQSFRQT